jgi:uncharacterized membrane protein YphA (DoxX/SURF4 family)
MAEASLLLRLALGSVFITSAISKFRAPEQFERSLRTYRVINTRLIPALARLILAGESAIGIALLLGLYPREAAIVAASALMSFGIALMTREQPEQEPAGCGCGGLVPDGLSLNGHLAANAALIGAAIGVAYSSNTFLAFPMEGPLDLSVSGPSFAAYTIAIGVPLFLLLVTTIVQLYRIRTLLGTKDRAARLPSDRPAPQGSRGLG